tara:strand:+ start:2238 stop:2681 length:444 start_codon:yes stop_codon:yes gene_type:complete
MDENEQHLQLLSIFHYVLGGIIGAVSLFPIFHLIFGLVMILSPETLDEEPDVAIVGWFLVGFATVFILSGWTLALFVIAAGRSIVRRKRHTFCLVMAGIECLFMPIGTILGVFTIIVLTKEPVRQAFGVPVSQGRAERENRDLALEE